MREQVKRQDGKDNTTGIIIYTGIVALFCVGLMPEIFAALAVLVMVTL
ncbi:MAG: hypothetical protein ABJB34_05635 [Acidobacteriota bacterium]